MQGEVVSIIVPVYNVGHYVENCIKSIISQTYRNIEIIIVNDGSTDDSGEICDRLKKENEKIRVIHTENKGVSNARNIGIAEASGEWIAFVDGDDFIENNYIETMYKKTKEIESIDIVMVGYYAEDENNKQKHQFFKTSQLISSDRKADLLKMCLSIDIEKTKGKTNIGVPWGKLYKRSLILDNCIRFPMELKKMQDTVFNIEVYDKANRIYYLDEPLYHYRIWNGSVCNRYFSQYDKLVELLIHEFDRVLKNKKYLIDYDEVINAKKLMLFVENIKLEYISDGNKESKYNKIKNIAMLSQRELYKSSFRIRNKYLSYKQKIMCILIKAKCFYLLYILLNYKYKKRIG